MGTSQLLWILLAVASCASTLALRPALARADAAEPIFQIRPYRRSIHHWERHVRGFRREHNFALSTGASSGSWHVKSFGALSGERFDASGVYGRFQYGFHLPFSGSFGYILGTACGYHYESSRRDSSFKAVPGTIFPGVLAGLVYDVNPALRLGTTIDASLERHNGMIERKAADQPTEVFVTMQAYDAAVFLDYFFDLVWALRLEAHRRQLEFLQPEQAHGYPVDANIRKSERWLGLGLVYHLL